VSRRPGCAHPFFYQDVKYTEATRVFIIGNWLSGLKLPESNLKDDLWDVPSQPGLSTSLGGLEEQILELLAVGAVEQNASNSQRLISTVRR